MIYSYAFFYSHSGIKMIYYIFGFEKFGLYSIPKKYICDIMKREYSYPNNEFKNGIPVNELEFSGILWNIMDMIHYSIKDDTGNASHLFRKLMSCISLLESRRYTLDTYDCQSVCEILRNSGNCMMLEHVFENVLLKQNIHINVHDVIIGGIGDVDNKIIELLLKYIPSNELDSLENSMRATLLGYALLYDDTKTVSLLTSKGAKVAQVHLDLLITMIPFGDEHYELYIQNIKELMRSGLVINQDDMNHEDGPKVVKFQKDLGLL